MFDPLGGFDIKEILQEFVTTKLADAVVNTFSKTIKKINSDSKKELIKLKKFDIENSFDYIEGHLKNNLKWASAISFRDATKPKNLTDIFIDLDLSVTPRKMLLDESKKPRRKKVSKLLLEQSGNVILLGQPGAGKTTTVKKLFVDMLCKNSELAEKFNFPVVIKLKDISGDGTLTLLQEIMLQLGVFVEYNDIGNSRAEEILIVHSFLEFVEKLNILIILDGFDEISSSELQDGIISNLRMISNSLVRSAFIMTSRSADYNVHIENTSVFEICDLSQTQVRSFIKKWLANPKEAESMISQIEESPYWDTTIRPLIVAHLCALYERNHSIPDKPKSVYRKIILLLLEDWSNQRSIKRISNYANFEVDRKLEFLSRFAFELETEYNTISFSSATLETIYRTICLDFDLPKKEAIHVIGEIESHNGLIIQTANDKFEFSHKSLLEYLVADYLVKLPHLIPDPKLWLKLPDEFAIVIAISSRPSYTFYYVVTEILKSSCANESFLWTFLSRLELEKPDFEASPLLGLTYIYILNMVAEQCIEMQAEVSALKSIEHRNYTENEQLDEAEEALQVLSNCYNSIVSDAKSQPMRRSIEEIKKIYKIGQVRVKPNSHALVFEAFGSTILHLNKYQDKTNIKYSNLQLIDHLYAPAAIF